MVDDLPSDGSQNFEQSQTLNLYQLPSSKIQKTLLREWSMVVIRDVQHHNDCSVFPPVNHENLHISSPSHQCDDISASPSSSSPSSSFPLSSSVSSFSPSDIDSWGLSSSLPSDSLVQKIGGFTGWVSIGLEILRSKLFAMVSLYRNYAAKRSAIWSIGPAAAAAVLSWWMYMRVWYWLKQRTRRTQTRRESHLMTIIKEKDEVREV